MHYSMSASNQNSAVVVEDLRDRFTALHKQEAIYQSIDYLASVDCFSKSNDGNSKKPVDEKCVETMSKWCYKLIAYCKASEETGSMAMAFLHRFLSSREGEFAIHDRQLFQLAVMCCLNLAMKMNESQLDFNIDTLLQFCRGCFTTEEVVLMEQEIVFALSWRLAPPTPHVFLDIMSEFLPLNTSPSLKKSIMQLARYQVNVSTCKYGFSTVKPSIIAYASIINSMETIVDFSRDACKQFIKDLANVAGIKYIDAVRTTRTKLRTIISTADGRSVSPVSVTDSIQE